MKLALMLLLMCSAAFAVCPPTSVPYYDGFGSQTLGSCWQWYNEDPTHWSLAARPGWMRLIAKAGFASTGQNYMTLPRPAGDFTMGARVQITPTVSLQQAGICIWLDYDNFLFFTRDYVPSFYNHITALYGVSGGSYFNQDFEPCTSNDVLLKMSLSGSTVTASFSVDGLNWLPGGAATLPWLSNPACRIGLTSGAPAGYEINADFDYFRIDGDWVLPVELLSFDARAEDQNVLLSWLTGAETNLSHFEITRDGVVMANVSAINSATGGSYQWRDVNLTNGREYSYTLTSVDFDGSREQIGQLHATPRADEVPSEFALLQNYPNPFNASTTIEFVLPAASEVSLTLHNLLGEQVATLAEGTHNAGLHRLNFDAASLTSGIYFYRLSAGNFTAQKKLVLIK
jgi:regulation of enolase protein 1 (concanavalin A-like superfamily)